MKRLGSKDSIRSKCQRSWIGKEIFNKINDIGLGCNSCNKSGKPEYVNSLLISQSLYFSVNRDGVRSIYRSKVVLNSLFMYC